MTEPLGESQVLEYLLDLVKSNSIYLLSFEKPTDKSKFQKTEALLNKAGIQWEYLKYSNQYGIFSSLLQILKALSKISKIAKKEKIQIVHTRSLIPAVMGLLTKKLFKTKLIFDIRGFAIDEKILEGRLQANSWLTRRLKNLEAYLYKKADHIVTLTHASKPIIKKNYHINDKSITVIPTCANVEIFKPIDDLEKNSIKAKLGFSKDDPIVLHNGSLNSWVDFEAEIKLFEQLSYINPRVNFLFLNKGQHDLIKSHLKNSHLPANRCTIISAELKEIPLYLNIADICVFFIKPSFAKQASAPTKFAEMVACHLPAISNSQYGDMEYYLNSYAVGLLFNLADVHNHPDIVADKVINFITNNKKTSPPRECFEHLVTNHFSKKVAVERYQSIYDSLARYQ